MIDQSLNPQRVELQINVILSLDADGNIEIESLTAARIHRWRVPFPPNWQKEDPQQADSSEGWVYVLEGGGYYKIGKTSDITRRIEEISPKLPFPVTLCWKKRVDDMDRIERNLHELFADKRTHGEWFQLDETDLAYLRRVPDG